MFARERERMSQWAIKRVCKFLLKKRLGDFILGDIDFDQLDVQLSQGTILLSDLALNVDLLNLKVSRFTRQAPIRDCIQLGAGMEQYQQWNQFQNGVVAQPQQGQGTNVPHSGITMTIKPRGLSIGPQQHSYPTKMDSYELNHFQSHSSDYASPDEVFQTGNSYQSQSSYQLEPERVESSSSNKRKSKMLAKNGDPKKGTPNKRWAQEYDDYLIPFLVEQAKKGMKVDKTFKRQAFTAAAAAVNAKFNESYSPENVINHLRVLKTRYQDICKCQNISGAGWDDEKKMITLEGPTYHTWAQAHSRLKEYVNKPLKHYEDLKIICGDDHATGSYRKAIFEQFGGNASETINLDDSTNEMDVETQANAEREHDVREIQGAGSSSVARSKSRASKHPKNRRDVMEMLIEKVGEMAYAMQNARIAHWSEKLSTNVYALDGFEFEVLDKAFNKLYEDENEARAFIAKPVMAQRSWMEKFNQKCDEEQL